MLVRPPQEALGEALHPLGQRGAEQEGLDAVALLLAGLRVPRTGPTKKGDKDTVRRCGLAKAAGPCEPRYSISRPVFQTTRLVAVAVACSCLPNGAQLQSPPLLLSTHVLLNPPAMRTSAPHASAPHYRPQPDSFNLAFPSG